MAPVTNLLLSNPLSSPLRTKRMASTAVLPLPSSSSSLSPRSSHPSNNRRSRGSVRVPRPTAPPTIASTRANEAATVDNGERVRQIHSTEEFDAALRAAKNRLVVIEYAASHSPNSRRLYPVMVKLSRTCRDVDFLLVMGDENDRTRELCRREGIDKVPHFCFYKGMEKIHEEEGIGPDVLRDDVLYYRDEHSLVVQLHSRADVEALMGRESGEEGRLVVLDVGLKHCGPCVKVYPTVVKLSRSMADVAVFARMNGDENESCMEFLKDMDVLEVPTFLFIRNGQIRGRYVGSGKGELIGEILRYQGVSIA